MIHINLNLSYVIYNLPIYLILNIAVYLFYVTYNFLSTFCYIANIPYVTYKKQSAFCYM